MAAAAILLQENASEAIYALAIPAPRPCTLRFSVTSEGVLVYDNQQPNARRCCGRKTSKYLAAAMCRTARERVPGALRNRTLRGLAFELRVHNRAYRLGLFRSHSIVTDMGGLDPQAPDYDDNALLFEHPLRSLPRILFFVLHPKS